MRVHLLFIVAFAVVQLKAQSPNLIGLITEINSNHRPVYPVQVKADFANPTTNETKGLFKLIFYQIPPGGNVRLTVMYNDWHVVNEKELNTKLSNKPQIDTLRIFMCSRDVLAQNRINFYNISIASVRKVYDKKLAQLNKKNSDYSKLVDKLNNEKNLLLQQAYELADKYAKINFDDISSIENAAFEEFQKGNIEKAIKILEGVNSKEIISSAKAEIIKWDNISKEAEDNTSIAKKALKQQIKKVTTQAELYKFNFQWEKAREMFEIAALADTTVFESVYKYAGFFLINSLQYDSALKWYNTALAASQTQEDSAIVLKDVGGLYADQKKYELSLELLHKSLKSFQDLQKRDWLLDKLELGDTYHDLATVYHELSDFKNAKDLYQKAIEAILAVKVESKEKADRLVSHCYANLGKLYSDEKNYIASEDNLKKSIEILEQLTKTNPADNERLLALSYSGLGTVDLDKNATGDFLVAESLFLKCLATLSKSSNSSITSYNLIRADAYINLANVYLRRGQLFKSEDYYMRGINAYKSVANKTKVFDHGFALAYLGLGNVHYRSKLYKKAATQYLESVSITENLMKDNPKPFRSGLSDLYYNLGNVYKELKDYQPAKEYFLKALQLRTSLAKENSHLLAPALANSNNQLGNTCLATKDTAEAYDYYHKAISILDNLEGGLQLYYNEFVETYILLGNEEYSKKNYDKAETRYKQALSIVTSLKTIDILQKEQSATSYYNLGLVYLYGVKNLHNAEDNFLRSIELRRDLLDTNKSIYERLLGINYHQLGNVYFESKDKFSSARINFEQALTFYQKTPEEFRHEIAEIIEKLNLLKSSSK